MLLIENIRESYRSIRSNLIRSVLTSLIISIGIASIVGMQVAIDAIESTVHESFSTVGVNKIQIYVRRYFEDTFNGKRAKNHPMMSLKQANTFIERFHGNVALYANLTGIGELKSFTAKTFPNTNIYGVNEDYFLIKGLTFQYGRIFSGNEIARGLKVLVLGQKVYQTLFKNNENAIGRKVTFRGTRFLVIGVLEERGNFSEDNFDGMAFMPLVAAHQLATGSLDYRLEVAVNNPFNVEMIMNEVTGIMRSIRGDGFQNPNSFVVEKNDRLREAIESIVKNLRIGGFTLGTITLFGAAITLINIMLASVTDRTNEIGIRKALGAKPSIIRQQFLIEAILICLGGGILGVNLGLIVGVSLAQFLGFHSFMVPWLWILVGIVVCVVVGLISGYYPAFKASRLDPIESLRFE